MSRLCHYDDYDDSIGWWAIFFPGLFFSVYMESPNPKKPRRLHTTGPKLRLTCQPATRPTGRAKWDPEDLWLGGPLILGRPLILERPLILGRPLIRQKLIQAGRADYSKPNPLKPQPQKPNPSPQDPTPHTTIMSKSWDKSKQNNPGKKYSGCWMWNIKYIEILILKFGHQIGLIFGWPNCCFSSRRLKKNLLKFN